MSFFPRRRRCPPSRPPTARGSQLPLGDARGEVLHRCSPFSVGRRYRLHMDVFLDGHREPAGDSLSTYGTASARTSVPGPSHRTSPQPSDSKMLNR
jgi:hypothetical protein